MFKIAQHDMLTVPGCHLSRAEANQGRARCLGRLLRVRGENHWLRPRVAFSPVLRQEVLELSDTSQLEVARAGTRRT